MYACMHIYIHMRNSGIIPSSSLCFREIVILLHFLVLYSYSHVVAVVADRLYIMSDLTWPGCSKTDIYIYGHLSYLKGFT